MLHHRKIFEHTVQNGETWETIAQIQISYQSETLELEIATAEPSLGETLPDKTEGQKYVQHIVKGNDTLRSIAKSYNHWWKIFA